MGLKDLLELGDELLGNDSDDEEETAVPGVPATSEAISAIKTILRAHHSVLQLMTEQATITEGESLLAKMEKATSDAKAKLAIASKALAVLE